MRLPCFEYLEPGTPKEALSMLSQQRENARIIAGGTDLLPKMKKGLLTPKILMSLKAVPDFSYIEDGDVVKIGAMTSLRQLEESPLIKNKFSFLADAAHSVGAVQIRNMGAVGATYVKILAVGTTVPLIFSVRKYGRNASRGAASSVISSRRVRDVMPFIQQISPPF